MSKIWGKDEAIGHIKAGFQEAMGEQSIEPAFRVLDNINHELTGKRWSGGDLTGTRADLERFIRGGEMSMTFYLSDGGYSRIHVEIVDIASDGSIVFSVFLTSNSTPRVQARWTVINGGVSVPH